MYQRHVSGQNHTLYIRGMAGIKVGLIVNRGLDKICDRSADPVENVYVYAGKFQLSCQDCVM